MAIDPREVVRGVTKLASLPEVCVRVNEMVDDPRFSAPQIAEVISRDTALSAQLLRIANSAFFNFPARIDTVTRAIMVIGERELRYLVLAMSAVRSFVDVPATVINMASFWRHSVYTAVLARLIARRCNVLHAERLFVAGLLHDVGLLVLLTREPAWVARALEAAEGSDEPLYHHERALLGTDHAGGGAVLLGSGNLPLVWGGVGARHHDPSRALENPLDATIVHLADITAHRAEAAEEFGGALPWIDPVAWELTGLEAGQLAELMGEAGPLFAESWALIQPLVRDVK